MLFSSKNYGLDQLFYLGFILTLQLNLTPYLQKSLLFADSRIFWSAICQ